MEKKSRISNIRIRRGDSKGKRELRSSMRALGFRGVLRRNENNYGPEFRRRPVVLVMGVVIGIVMGVVTSEWG